MEKEEKSKTVDKGLLIALMVVAFAIGTLIGYYAFGLTKDEKPKEENNETETTTQEQNNTIENTNCENNTSEKNDIDDMVTYKYYEGDDGELYLFSNNTFILHDYIDCGRRSYGYYVENNNEIQLTEEIQRNCDVCFYTDELETYKFKISGNTITDTEDNAQYTLTSNDTYASKIWSDFIAVAVDCTKTGIR